MNSIKVSDKSIQIKVSVFVYLDTEHPDGNMYIAYCPSLNLIGYGNGEDNAKKDFEWIMGDYLHDMIRQGTLEQDLKEHGWTVTKSVFNEPRISDMMSKDKDLKDFIDDALYHRITVNQTCPAFA